MDRFLKRAAWALGLAVLLSCRVWAQEPAEPPGGRVAIPWHGDPRASLPAPTGPLPASLRVVTDDEFPPLHMADADGLPAGFSVELMRAVCERLGIACTIQVRRFDTLLQSLAEGQADVVAAAIPLTADLKAGHEVSQIYHRLPGRFVARADGAPPAIADGLAGRRVSVMRDTAHAAFLAERFPAAERIETADAAAALARLMAGEADLAFGDGQALALWLGSRAGEEAVFAGGPYLDARLFGEGIGFIVRRGDVNLKRGIDQALRRLWDDGTWGALFLRHFPVSPF